MVFQPQVMTYAPVTKRSHNSSTGASHHVAIRMTNGLRCFHYMLESVVHAHQVAARLVETLIELAPWPAHCQAVDRRP